MMHLRLIAVAFTWVVVCSMPTNLWSQTRDEQVRNDRQSLLNDENWIYDDLDAALAQAKAEDKPIMAVLRCIP